MKKTNILVEEGTLILLKKLEEIEKKDKPAYARIITHDFIIFKLATLELNRKGIKGTKVIWSTIGGRKVGVRKNN